MREGHPQLQRKFDEMKYLHKENQHFDYLLDISENEVKIHLKFTKDEEKHRVAKNAIKSFFLELY